MESATVFLKEKNVKMQINDLVYNEVDDESKHILWIDIAKGIAIVAVIIGHNIDGEINNLINSFHMPLFFFVSGYTFKANREKYIKDFKRLIVPYIILVIIQTILMEASIGVSTLSKICWGNITGVNIGNMYVGG